MASSPFTIGTPSGNMVSDFLGGNTPKYNPFEGTPLGTKYTPEMFGPSQNYFGPSQDYSSIFASAAARPYNPPDFGGRLTPGTGSSGGSRPSSSRSVSGGAIMAPGEPAPLDFYMGPAPTLEGLNLDYQEMGRRAMEANAPYRQQYEQMLPGFGAGLKAMGQLANQQLSGQIPLDVAQQVGRSSAAAKLGAGIAGGGLGRNLTARDLGLSSLQIQQSGADLLAKSSGLAQQAMQAMSPIAAGQVFGEAVNQASINQQIGNQNLMNAWQSKGRPGQFDVTKGQYIGYQPGTYSAYKPLTPDLQHSQDLQNRVAKLNSQSYANRFRVSGGKILDSYSGKTI